jgi:hypothetical protein
VERLSADPEQGRPGGFRPPLRPGQVPYQRRSLHEPSESDGNHPSVHLPGTRQDDRGDPGQAQGEGQVGVARVALGTGSSPRLQSLSTFVASYHLGFQLVIERTGFRFSHESPVNGF